METPKNIIYLPLEDVDSEHCALIVDKGLAKVNGIESHTVELNNRRANITAANTDAVADAVAAIRDLGYGVTTITGKFPVVGMTCASCASSAASVVRHASGVVGASVNYGTGDLTVEYLPNMTSTSAIQKAVQSAGYDLMIDDSDAVAETLEEINARRYANLKFKTIWALILSAPVVTIGMFFMEMPYANLIMLLFTTPVIFWLGADFFKNAWKQARHRSANMDTLVAMSTGIAYLFSVFNMLFADYWLNKGLQAHVYFEAAAVVIAFILLGKLLEEKAKGNTSSAIKKLMGLQPMSVTVIGVDGSEKQIPIDDIAVKDIIAVKPGEKIAVDGVLVTGSSYVDESTLTGEPMAVLKNTGDPVFAGTINQKGSFQFEAVKVGRETMLAQIIKMVQDAQGSRAPVQKLVDKIAAVFVPVVIGIALLTCIIWYALGGINGLEHGIMAAVTVLIIACPCALGLATPTAIMVGVGKGADNGILIKDAESLELAKNIDVIILDKTGTITEGRPEVTDIYWVREDDLQLRILLGIEKQSEHPLADAVVKHLGQREPVVLNNFHSITGRGASAEHENQTYLVGNLQLLKEHGITVPQPLIDQAAAYSAEAKSLVWFANSSQALALLAVSDTIKDTSVSAIREIENMGIAVHMLTGDNKSSAEAVARQAGILHFQSDMMPQQKSDFVKKLQQQGQIVAMVGDGINDSAALATADVSIAMGKGSDIAMDVAKMTIISSDLSRIPQAIRLSKQTVSTIKQNLFWAFIYNIIGIPLAAGVVYPVNGFLLDPMIAGAAMALSSVSVVGNSLRLKFMK